MHAFCLLAFVLLVRLPEFLIDYIESVRNFSQFFTLLFLCFLLKFSKFAGLFWRTLGRLFLFIEGFPVAQKSGEVGDFFFKFLNSISFFLDGCVINLPFLPYFFILVFPHISDSSLTLLLNETHFFVDLINLIQAALFLFFESFVFDMESM